MSQIKLSQRERDVAMDYHGGQESMLYAAGSTGALRVGRLRSGTTEAEQMRILADRLASEAEEASDIAGGNARAAASAQERRDSLAEKRVLDGLAKKARAFLAKPPPTSTGQSKNARASFEDKVSEVARMRFDVEPTFVPLFDHMITLARHSQSVGYPQRAGQELAKARKIAAENPREKSRSELRSEIDRAVGR